MAATTCTISRAGLKDSISSTKIGTGSHFTGTVNLEPVLSAEGISVGNVCFSPGARTNWHWHEKGQLLRVKVGKGWVCDKDGKPKRIRAGDAIWCPPGTTHWHGADAECYMVHEAVSHGGVQWYDTVGDKEYGEATEGEEGV